jgi:hypothetical protein
LPVVVPAPVTAVAGEATVEAVWPPLAASNVGKCLLLDGSNGVISTRCGHRAPQVRFLGADPDHLSKLASPSRPEAVLDVRAAGDMRPGQQGQARIVDASGVQLERVPSSKLRR